MDTSNLRVTGYQPLVTPRELGVCELMTMPIPKLLDWIEVGVSP